jgi:hypothetical protein
MRRNRDLEEGVEGSRGKRDIGGGERIQMKERKVRSEFSV